MRHLVYQVRILFVILQRLQSLHRLFGLFGGVDGGCWECGGGLAWGILDMPQGVGERAKLDMSAGVHWHLALDENANRPCDQPKPAMFAKDRHRVQQQSTN